MGKKNIAFINPKMLKWARSETPFNSTELIEREFGFSADKINAWENGEDYPTITEAKKLAALYKVPFACFYLTATPEKKPKRYVDRRTVCRGAHSELSYSLWAEICRIQSNRESIIEYLDSDAPECIISVVDDNTPGAIASSIRDYLGLDTPLKNKTAYGPNPFNYYRSIIERKQILVAQISGVPLSEMKGLSIYYDDVPIIAINNKDYDNSKVFSLFHELAHIFRRSSSLCSLELYDYSDEEERLCDRIAAEALMPRETFFDIATIILEKFDGISLYNIERIAGRFGVSPYATLIRLHETNIISDNEFFSLLDEIKADYQRNLAFIEASRKGKNVPIHYYVKYLNQNGALLPRTIITAQATGRITHGEMCRILGVNTKHIGNIEQAVMFK